MRIRKNGTVVNLTESDLQRIVKRTLNEQISDLPTCKKVMGDLAKEELEKNQNKGKVGKGDKRKPRTGTVASVQEKVILKTSAGPLPDSGVVIAYKGGKPFCKCG